MTHRQPTILAQAAIAMVMALAVLSALYCFAFSQNVTGFFRIGSHLPTSPVLNPASVLVFQGQDGYDGQMFLTIALDPALRMKGTAASLDDPKYRYRRIGYPIAGYLLGLGKPGLIPYALVVLNLVSIIWLVVAVSGLLRAGVGDPSPPSALWVLAIPGVWIALTLSTADLFGSALFAGALLMLRRRRHFAAAAFMCAALLTRETYLATTLVLTFFMLFNRERRAAIALAISMVPVSAWLSYVYAGPLSGTIGASNKLSLPLAGIAEKLRTFVTHGLNGTVVFDAFCVLLLLCAALLLAYSVLSFRRSLTVVHAAAAPGLGILAVITMEILGYHVGYLRIFLDLWVLLLLVPGDVRFRQFRTLVFAGSAVASAALVINYVTMAP